MVGQGKSGETPALCREGSSSMAHVSVSARPRRTASLPLLVLGTLALYIVGLDQGLLLSVTQGAAAFDQNLIHELVHDARHSAGFPCH